MEAITRVERPPEDLIAAYPEYAATHKIDVLRASEYAYLDREGQVYLDYTGAGVAAHTQLERHASRLAETCYGNPHSENPSSRAASALVESARRAVLDYTNASPEEYTVIFTANATGACHLVGEAYPFRRGSYYVLTADNHNSVNGIREYARAHGARIRYVPVSSPDLRIKDSDVVATLHRHHALLGGHPQRLGLFAYPAQSNFTGVQHPLEWVDLAHERGYDVLLDAAAFAPTNRLDLGACHPEFVCLSWYKLFGYPTGVGCLIVRRDAMARLRRPWFAGGTIRVVSVGGAWHQLMDDESAFEDGTVNFLSIPDVEVGLRWLEGIGIDLIHTRVRCLTGWLLDRLLSLRHSNGRPMVRIYGPTTTDRRGGTIALNLVDPAGALVDERVVAAESAAAGFSIRTGCFCNPGVGERAFTLKSRLLRRAAHHPIRTFDDYLGSVAMPTGGAVRVSIGLASNAADVERFVNFAESTYRDRAAGMSGLPPRVRC